MFEINNFRPGPKGPAAFQAVGLRARPKGPTASGPRGLSGRGPKGGAENFTPLGTADRFYMFNIVFVHFFHAPAVF